MAGPTAADLLPSEAAALASLQQELQWLQQDVQQQNQGLAAAAQGLIAELTAAAPGSCGHCAGMLDVVHARRLSQDPDPAAGAAQALASTAAAEPMAARSAAAVIVAAAAASSNGEQVQVSNCLPTVDTAGAAAAGLAGIGAGVTAAGPELAGRVDAAGTAGAAVQAAATVTQSAQGDQAAAAAAACSSTVCPSTRTSKCDDASTTEPVTQSSNIRSYSSSRDVSNSGCSLDSSRGQCHGESASTEPAPGSSDTATGSSTGSSSTAPSTCCSAACSSSDSYECRSTTSLPHLMEAQESPQGKQVTAALPQGGSPTMSAQCADFDLQQLLWQHPFAPSSLRHELLQAYSTLLQQHQQQLQASSAQQRMHAARCCSWTGDEHTLFVWLRAQALQDASAACPTVKTISRAGCGGRPAGSLRAHASTGRGGSSGSSSSNAVSGSGAAGGAGNSRSSGCSRSSVLQYVGLRMPGKTRQELERHEDW